MAQQEASPDHHVGEPSEEWKSAIEEADRSGVAIPTRDRIDADRPAGDERGRPEGE